MAEGELGEGGSLQPVFGRPLGALVHEVPSVGIPGDVGSVIFALVQELPCEHCQSSSLHLQWNEVLLSVVLLVVVLIGRHALMHLRSKVKLTLVAPWQAPQTPVFYCCILQGNPKSKQGIRLRVEVG